MCERSAVGASQKSLPVPQEFRVAAWLFADPAERTAELGRIFQRDAWISLAMHDLYGQVEQIQIG